MSYGTLPSRFLNGVDAHPNPRAQLVRADGVWKPFSSAEILRRVSGLCCALVELGVKPGDRVSIFAPNRPEWHVADFAITGAGAVSVPVYFNESPERMAYILNHSSAKAVVVAGQQQAAKLLEIRAQLPSLEHIIISDGGPDVPADCLLYETLIASAGDAEIARYRALAAQVLPGQIASLIYTSGTTGEPKGVMLSHTNFCSNATDTCVAFDLQPSLDVALSFLPLSHVYGRLLDYVYLFHGVTIAYVEEMNLVPAALVEIRPTVLAAVPRFFEKIYARIMEQGSRLHGPKKSIFTWGLRVAARSVPWKAAGREPGLALRLQYALADKIVFRKIRAATGGRLRIAFSGGGPLSQDLIEFFWSVGVPVYQGYGLTETSPIVSSNYPANRVGSSGKIIPNVHVRIAEDGEILIQGPLVMQGYYQKPEDTRAVLDQDGWFATGDIGYLDADGYLFITDRKKDLLKTAAGKFVAPQPIENKLKTSPYILNAMVVGDRRKFVSAVLVPNCETVSAKAATEGKKFASSAELAADPWTRALIDSEVQRLTANLAQYESIKRFALIPEDFTFQNGGLTYTMKLKRRVVEQQYRDVIDKLYADVAEPRPMQMR